MPLLGDVYHVSILLFVSMLEFYFSLRLIIQSSSTESGSSYPSTEFFLSHKNAKQTDPGLLSNF